MTRNPYLPPRAAVSDRPIPADSTAAQSAVDGLYSSNQLFAASFIGAPIAAAWFAAHNVRALGKADKARKILFWGAFATVLVLGMAFVLPEDAPNIILPLAYSLAIRALSEKMFKEHAGGVIGSWWRVVSVSFAWLLVVLAVLLGVIFGLEQLGILTDDV
jgi:hypothetical protein